MRRKPRAAGVSCPRVAAVGEALEGAAAVALRPDSDGDGVPDGGTNMPVNEADFGSDPHAADSDLDGLSDLAELTRGFSQPTNPLQADIDGDGILDPDDEHPRFPIEESILSSTPVRDGKRRPRRVRRSVRDGERPRASERFQRDAGLGSLRLMPVSAGVGADLTANEMSPTGFGPYYSSRSA